MLTIGDLARLAGTTVRAVRHYHAVGLLDEPERDHSGYRRYGSAALVRVLRIRRMRDLGLPLDRIGALLDGSAVAMQAALDDLDAELAAQAERITARRAALARLRTSGLDPELPARLGVLYARAAAAGVPERANRMEKDVVLLDLALHPEQADEIVAQYEALAGRTHDLPGFAELNSRFDALADAAAVDPAEAQELAVALAAAIRDQFGLLPAPRATNPRTQAMFADWFDGLPPAQRALMERVLELAGR